jgi:integrase
MPIYKVDGAKKDGLQKYKVRVNYISNSDGKPKQLTRTAYGLEAAKDLERRLVDEVSEKNKKTVKKMTVEQLFVEYEAAQKYEVREATLDKAKRNYKIYVQPTMSDIRIDKLTIPLLQKWKVSIEQKNFALNTKKAAYKIFRALLNFGVKMEYLPHNPLTKIGNFKDSFDVRPNMKIYTPLEFTKYISVAKQLAEQRQAEQGTLSEWDFYVFFNIAFFTGLRKGEIHALRWSDIEDNFLCVKRSITQKLKGDDRETPPKNKSSIRTIQMPLPLIHVLNDHRKRQEKLDNFSEDYHICGAVRSLRDSTIQNRNKTFAKIAGLDVIRIHDFRHSHVSVLVNADINIKEISRRLCHSRFEETWNTYAHMYPHEEEKAVDVLNVIAA